MRRLGKPVLLFWLCALALPAAGLASGASSPDQNPKTEENFSAYHDLLTKAAQNMLARASDQPSQELLPQARPESNGSAAAVDEDRLRQFANVYWNGRAEELRQAVTRLLRIKPTLVRLLLAEGVPPDLAAVVLIESAAQPTAQSRRGARGLWQFMPETARRYGLSVEPGRDDRLELEQATRAAAGYLRDLYQRFGNWPLALAAYNAGEQAVQRAIDRSRSTDFARLSALRLLPEETRRYVPAVLAVLDLLGDSGALTQRADFQTKPREPRILFAQTSAKQPPGAGRVEVRASYGGASSRRGE